MKVWESEEYTWMAACPRFILLGLILLLLLAGPARGQSRWPPAPGEYIAADRGEPQVVLRGDLFKANDRLKQSPRHPAPPQVADQAAPGWPQDLVGESPPASGPWPAHPWCPLPPASAFSLQTNLCKYLDTWPTPGATVAPDEPADDWEADEEDLH
jgi:hypothetical protein